MKKIALISTFCDNQEKLNLLKENITKIKSFDVDVMVISPLKLDDETIELSDYLIYTKENPVLNWPEKSYFQWWGCRKSLRKANKSLKTFTSRSFTAPKSASSV